MSYVCHTFHIVFSTKERRPLIDAKFQQDLYKFIGGIIRKNSGVLIEAGGVSDPIHLLARLHQSIAHADVIRDVKSGSSRWVNEKGLCKEQFHWQEKYGSFTVSRSVEPEVITYLRNQEQHHQTMSFQEEFRAWLKKHGEVVDERYVWM